MSKRTKTNFRFSSRSRNIKRPKEDPEPKFSLLKEFCKSDSNLCEALSNYLLIEPRSQLPLLGSSESHCENGLKWKMRGNLVSARVEIEIAARIEICKFNMQKVRDYLTLADTVSNLPVEIERHKVLLSNLEKVRKIAEEYYKAKGQLVTEEIPQIIAR